MNIVVLVDYDNDSVRTALAVAEALGPRLWGVRLDTSNTMVDRSLWPQMGRFDPRGVNPQLVWNVRNALDAAGYGAVRIVASGGFTAEKIRAFEAAGVPGRLVRRRLRADPRRERFHGRRGRRRRRGARQGGPGARPDRPRRAGPLIPVGASPKRGMRLVTRPG